MGPGGESPSLAGLLADSFPGLARPRLEVDVPEERPGPGPEGDLQDSTWGEVQDCEEEPATTIGLN